MNKFVYTQVKKLIPLQFKKVLRKILLYRKYKDTSLKLTNSEGKPRFILMCTPEHGNLGDHAIAVAEIAFLSDYFPEKDVCEVTGDCFRALKKSIVKKIHSGDILIISGGGFLGSLWMLEEELVKDIIISFPNNKIVIFPQTVFFEGNVQGNAELSNIRRIFSSHNNILFAVRDNKSINSAEKMLGGNGSVVLMPDISLYLMYKNLNVVKVEHREGLLVCMRKDKERDVKSSVDGQIAQIVSQYGYSVKNTDTSIDQVISPTNRKKMLEQKLDEFASSRLVITDRLHGMIFAALTKTPCIALNSLSGKVAGAYEWLKGICCIVLLEEGSEMIDCAKKLDSMSCIRNNNLKTNFDEFAKKLKLFELIIEDNKEVASVEAKKVY